MFVPNRRILDKRFVSQVVTEPVKEFALSAGLKYGDSVFGSVSCLDIRTQANDILHLSIKSVLPMTGIIDKNTLSRAKLSVALKFFAVEICYYEQIRPAIVEALKAFGDKLEKRNTLFITPRYFSSHTDIVGLHDYLALEDLKPCGYKANNKFNGLTFNEVTATSRELALLHAVSYVLLETKHEGITSLQQDPECLLNKHFWNRLANYDTNNMKDLYDGIASSTIGTMKKKGTKIPDGLDSFASSGHPTIINLWKKTSISPKYFRVLVHGNAWTNNVLFNKVAFGKAVDVKLINFQQARFGNIYEDLLYFLFTSTTEEFRCNHLNTCLATYFNEFVKIVECLNFHLPEGFTEQNMIATFNENINYGFSCNLVEIPFQLGMQPPPPSPMTPVESSDDMRKFFSNMSFDSENNLPTVDCEKNDDSDGKVTIKSVSNKLVETLKIGLEHSPVAQTRLTEMFHEMSERGIL